ncbi:hypothetical protein [Streptomyces sp. NPDC053755]|uniref:hypothetical protein n=1 Tax=Streptomyces sp. NPDC053755 TaxID=3155815 RepID=UPI00342994D1
MSGTENPRRKRTAPLVASVTAGVLLIGGGGVYVATTASDGGAGGTRSSSAPPPPLHLDAKGGTGGDGPGIAPGEPDPNDGGAVYKAKGPLPKGPSSAAVHRPEGRVTSAEVTRLATALGIAGAPRLEGAVWKIAPEKDGSGLRLDVSAEAPGSWTVSRYDGGPAGDTCLKGRACPPPGEPKPPRGGTAVSEAAAKAAAAPVLKAIGQSDAAVDASQVMNGSVRVVNADPVVGGLPTYGWSTGIHIGPDGTPVAGSGHLKEPSKDDTYPVLGATGALEELNKASAGGRIGIGGCASDPPATADGPAATCEPDAEPRELSVTGAVFGLASQFVNEKRVLVPSWLFRVEPQGGGTPYTVVQTAVAPEHLAPPVKPSAPPAPDEGTAPARRIESYRTDSTGTALAVTFWGGVCSTYTVSADQGPGKVSVRVSERPSDPDRVCVAMAVEVTKTVTLTQPLGARSVMDAASGEPVPRK